MIKWGATYAVVGSKNSGKSTMMKNLVLIPGMLGSLADIVIVLGNGSSLETWDFLKFKNSPHKVVPFLDNELIKTCFRNNEKRRKEKKVLVRYLFVLDDCLSITTKNNEQVLRLFQFGRHSSCIPIACQQSIVQLHPDIRRNVDVWFCFKPRTDADRKFIYDNLISEFYEKKAANAMMYNMKPYVALVVSFLGGKTKQTFWKAKNIST